MQAQDHTELRQCVLRHLSLIYPDDDHQQIANSLFAALLDDSQCALSHSEYMVEHWDQQDILLITYGDSIKAPAEVPLVTLKHFLDEQLKEVITGVHILPFFPYSSDDGFSVIDYAQVNPSLGQWQDIEAIGQDYRLMADLVINHCSSRSLWFEQFKNQQPPGRDFFIEADPQRDLSEVVRPRTSPLLRAVQTSAGEKHVWCTFSHDQVDLNFANPQVLVEFIKIIKLYLNKGVGLFRLDAVAFLWKELGTNCLNLPQTHEIIRLLRTLINFYDPTVLLVTETNIPNRENLAYFGNGTEAHMIYNFSLPPLLLHTLLTGNCLALKQWQMSMPPAQANTSYLNFIASHDGIGLRPAEGILTDEQINDIARQMESFGGKISWRSLGTSQDPSTESLRPYEINIALIDALKGTMSGQDQYQIERFLCAHAIMLSLEGLPALYIHSLLGTENDLEKMANTGNNRSINRHNWDYQQLCDELAHEGNLRQVIFSKMKHLIQLRQAQKAFHPNATQYVLHLGEQLFGAWRQSNRREQSVFAITNVSDQVQSLPLTSLNLTSTDCWWDLMTGQAYPELYAEVELAPYQIFWLTNAPKNCESKR